MGVMTSPAPRYLLKATSMLVPAVFIVLMKMNLYRWEMSMDCTRKAAGFYEIEVARSLPPKTHSRTGKPSIALRSTCSVPGWCLYNARVVPATALQVDGDRARC